MNICDYIRENGLDFKMIGGKMHQTADLYLANNNITSLDGFVQTATLYLSGNNITSLDGFVQTADLNLANNNITSLDGFVQTDYLYLSNNKSYPPTPPSPSTQFQHVFI